MQEQYKKLVRLVIIVGIVYLTSDHYSVVIPILNSKSNISCKVKNSDYFGFLKWNGGSSQYANICIETLLADCLLPYNSDTYYYGSLAEPLSCVIGTFHAMYHTKAGSYVHEMGIKEGGKMALLASVGPMGLAAIDYAIHCDRKPSLLVVTDIDEARLERAASIYTVEDAKANGIELHYVNTRMENATEYLRELTGGTGYDDVVCFAPVKPVIEQADDILGFDGCLNFFAGPTDSQFKAPFNWYNVHYLYTHVVGTSGGNTNDMQEAIAMMNKGLLNPSGLVTHIGGLNAVVETTLNLPKIPGGKKLIYTQIDLPLVAISEFEEKGKTDPMFAELDRMCKANNGLWNPEDGMLEEIQDAYLELEGFLEEDMGDAAGEFQGSSIEITPRDQMEVFRKNAQKLHAVKGKRGQK